jgi:hypothetical protein
MTLRIDIKRKVGCLALGLEAFFAAMDFSNAATNETPRLVSADLRQTNGPLDTMFKFCVGAGRANEGCAPNGPQLNRSGSFLTAAAGRA